MAGKRILVMDDDQDIIIARRQFLKLKDILFLQKRMKLAVMCRGKEERWLYKETK